jgi:hypothetical protein
MAYAVAEVAGVPLLYTGEDFSRTNRKSHEVFRPRGFFLFTRVRKGRYAAFGLRGGEGTAGETSLRRSGEGAVAGELAACAKRRGAIVALIEP